MSIIERIRRAAEAGITGEQAPADGPEALLHARIRELEAAVEGAQEALASYAVTHKRLEKNTALMQRSSAEWQKKAQAAVEQGDDETARAALGEQVDAEDQLALSRASLKESTKTYDQLKGDLAALRDKLVAARLKVKDIQARQRAIEARKAIGEAVGSSGGGTEIETLEESLSSAENGLALAREIRQAEADLDARLERSEREKRIEDALQKLKKHPRT